MKTLLYIQFAIFFIYTFFVWRKYGIQRSISESWYVVDKKYKWMFSMFCFCLGALQCFHVIHGSVWFFLSGSSLVFVGVATDFKSTWRINPCIHNIGAVGSIVLGLIGLAVMGIWWPFIPVAVGAVTLPRYENGTWWIEVVAFFSILVGLAQLYL